MGISRTKRFCQFVFITVLTGIAVFVHDQTLKIKTITCQFGSQPCPEPVEKLLDSYRNKSLLLLNKKTLVSQLTGTGMIEDVHLGTKLPGQIIISATPVTVSFYFKSIITDTYPFLSFQTSSISAQIISPSRELAEFTASISSETFRLLSTGTISPVKDTITDYFLINNVLPQKSYLQAVFSWFMTAKSAGIRSEVGYILPNMIILKYKGQPDLVVNVSNDPNEVATALQRLGSVVTMRKPTVIDFRYNHPILK